MNKNYRTLDFFCVGAAKSGTTSMHNYLRQHPQIYMPLKKEIHHFADDILQKDDFWLNQKAFFEIYKKAKMTQICGETSVFYLISENAAKNIYKHNPNAKILIMLRNPVEVMYSLHSQLVFNGEENIIDFNHVLKLDEKRTLGECLPLKTRIGKKHIYFQVVNYLEQILRFKLFFADSQIKLVLYEDFKKNTPKIVQEIYKFLNVDETFCPNLDLYNENKKIKSKAIKMLTDFISFKILSRFCHVDTIEIFRNFITKINSIKEPRKPLNNEIKIMIINKLRPDIQKLEKNLNFNLSHWYE